MSPPRHSLPVVVGVLLLTARCDCTPKPGGDDGGSLEDGGDVDAGTVIDAGSTGDSGGFGDGGCTLKPNGVACGADGECCSNRCAVVAGSDGGVRICVTGSGACFGIGEKCTANVECCGGRTCAPDTLGQKRCIDESFCAAAGRPCARASDCCSMVSAACRLVPTNNTRLPPAATRCRYFRARNSPRIVSRTSMM